MGKLNCWEFEKCGRQPGGEKIKDKGVCPVALEKKAHGIHEGANGGRVCWVIAGSFCGGKVQGTYADKINNCLVCKFYKKVRDEEGTEFQTLRRILEMLKKADAK